MISALIFAALLPDSMATWPSWRAIATNGQEKHLSNIRQLTFGGQNAEAYWSKDGRSIIFQSRQPDYPDEQIFIMNADGTNRRLVSTGKGRCTCSYFAPDGSAIYFSSTHERNEGAQKPIDMTKGYVWMVNPDFAIYKADPDGKNVRPIIKKSGYVAETTVDPNGNYITFTGGFEGDLEIYRAKPDGAGITRLTNEVGYDGGPFVSWDGKKIVYRRDLNATPKEIEDYQALLKENMVRPSKLEIWVMDADGRNKKQVTKLGCASFAPFIHPDGKTIIFSSNYGDPKGREFNIWKINIDGSGLEQVTFEPEFDGFPMFSRDGKKLVFASNRNGKVRGETNVFVADWKD